MVLRRWEKTDSKDHFDTKVHAMRESIEVMERRSTS